MYNAIHVCIISFDDALTSDKLVVLWYASDHVWVGTGTWAFETNIFRIWWMFILTKNCRCTKYEITPTKCTQKWNTN